LRDNYLSYDMLDTKFLLNIKNKNYTKSLDL